MIDISSKIRSPLPRHLYNVAAPLIERGLAIRDYNAICENSQAAYRKHPEHPSARAWFDSVVGVLGARYEADVPSNFSLPEGPLVVVSNHPFGLIDPVILGDVLTKYRSQVKFMTNFLLHSVEDMRPYIIPVDPFNSKDSAKRNLGPIKEAMRFLKQGGALVIFPSGEVAHYKMGRGIEESPWSSHVGALVRRTQATVLPVYFTGHNSVLFHTAGLVHPMLRTGLLLRELVQRTREVTEVRIGQPLPYAKLRKFEDDESLTRYLRLHTFVLSQRTKSVVKARELESTETTAPPQPTLNNTPTPTPTASVPLRASGVEDFQREIARLREGGTLLAQQGNFSAFVAGASEIPHLLREIGRLREITFREVGEGTGESVDIDKYDEHYQHLFLWDDQAQQIAGAYRLGQADVILRRFGSKGLYTSTLFKFQRPFLSHLEDAVEMGRSFVCSQYQRNLSAMPLLWRGILTWVARNPRYKKLFGPVSISQDYHGLSRKLIVEFLNDNRLHPDLATLVKPRNPFRYMRNRKLLREFISAELTNLDNFSALISSIEEDGKGLPVLLKHYLKLKGTLLSFNVDKSFSSCLDGLIMVDLTQSEPKLLMKYMGEDATRVYMAHHGVEVQ